MKNVLVFLCLGIIIFFKSNASFDLKGNGLKSDKNLTEPTFACGVSAGATFTTINENQSTELIYTGCTGGSVNWTQGPNPVSNFVYPTTSTTYTAHCINGSSELCTSDIFITVIPCLVNPSASPSTISSGGSSTLSHTGCETGVVT